MSNIDENTIKQVAKLSHLDFDDQDLTKFKDEFASIVDFFDELATINTDQVEPTYRLSDEAPMLDKDEPTLYDRTKLLRNTEVREDLIKVPRML